MFAKYDLDGTLMAQQPDLKKILSYGLRQGHAYYQWGMPIDPGFSRLNFLLKRTDRF